MRQPMRVSVTPLLFTALAALVDAAATANPRLPSTDPDGSANSLLQRPARLHVESATLVAALEELHRRSGVNLFFSPSQTPDRIVTCPCHDATVEEALTQILKGTDLRYRQVDTDVVIVPTRAAPRPQSSVAQIANIGNNAIVTRVEPQVEPPRRETGTVLGRVVDAATGEGIPSVDLVLVVEETRLQATTAENGSYRLADVPAGSHDITAAGQGYTAQTQAIAVRDGEEVTVDFTLQLAHFEEKIVVTGTHVPGEAPVGSSPVQYDRTDIEQLGVATLGQFAEKLPQNFSSVSPVADAYGTQAQGISQSGANAFGGSAFNLRGLGPGSTLTLVNGRRLAGGGGSGSFVDVSLIPVSAVERIEILNEGASAVYGADAIAGVVNLILRKDYKGAETSVRSGTTTEGGATEWMASQLVGAGWSRGNVTLVYQYDQQGPLASTKRRFIPDQGGRVDITPEQQNQALFASGRQELGTNTSLQFDAHYGQREFSEFRSTTGVPVDSESTVTQGGGALSLERSFGNWRVIAAGTFGRMRQSLDSIAFLDPDDPFTQRFLTKTELGDIVLSGNGNLAALPAGTMKLAVGTETRFERLETGVTLITPQSLSRRVISGFSELYVPLIGPENARAWAERLQLSVAARYDEYDDVGSAVSPKVGLLWSPTSDVDFRGTYGQSFRAPPLDQLAPNPAFLTWLVADSGSPDGFTNTLVSQSSGLMSLEPETSVTVTAGMDIHPAVVAGLQYSMTYFLTNFKDRIARPPVVGSIFEGADIFAEPILQRFIQLIPPLAEIEEIFNGPGFFGDLAGEGPGGVRAIFRQDQTNIAKTTQSGINFSAQYDWGQSSNRWSVGADGIYFIKNEFTPVSGAGSLSLLNVVGSPIRLRSRAYINWSRGAASAGGSFNYATSYSNPLFTPPEKVDTWTTVDLYGGYHFDSLAGLRLTFTIQNLFDEDPPAVRVPAPSFISIGFDALNASPRGRIVAAQLTKSW